MMPDEFVAKGIEVPDSVSRQSPLLEAQAFDLPLGTVIRGIHFPGWHWLRHAGPSLDVQRCPKWHVGVVESGRLRVELSAGTKRDLRRGDVFQIPPGHDAWVLGDEPCVFLDFAGILPRASP